MLNPNKSLRALMAAAKAEHAHIAAGQRAAAKVKKALAKGGSMSVGAFIAQQDAARLVKPKKARAAIDPEVRTSMLTARQTGKIPGQPDITHDVTTKHLRAIEADRKKELSKASTGAVPKKGMATHVTEHVSSKAKAKIAGLAASVGDKHKKVQAKVNKHLGDSTAAFDRADAHLAKRTRHHQERIHARMQTDAALVSAEKHAAKAATLKKQLPQGYAMVFGKLRKITAGKPRTGIAKLKR